MSHDARVVADEVGVGYRGYHDDCEEVVGMTLTGHRGR